ncbi:MAG TPA: hypothetical protein VF134_08645 [Candidatus Dormibacteraeota bacterium]
MPGIKSSVMLKSAWEIALEKSQEHERLSHVTEELLEHVMLLEEGWNAIRPRDQEDAEPFESRPLAA